MTVNKDASRRKTIHLDLKTGYDKRRKTYVRKLERIYNFRPNDHCLRELKKHRLFLEIKRK